MTHHGSFFGGGRRRCASSVRIVHQAMSTFLRRMPLLCALACGIAAHGGSSAVSRTRASTICGKVSTGDGSRADGIVIALQSVRTNRPHLLASVDCVAGTRYSRVDANGDYVFSGLGPGLWRVGPVVLDEPITAQLSPTYVVDAYTCESQVVRLASAPDSAVVDFTIEPPMYVSGYVVNPKGNPVDSAVVVGVSDVSGDGAHTVTESDGRFTLGPFAKRIVTITASQSLEYQPSTELRVVAGTNDLVLELAYGRTLDILVDRSRCAGAEDVRVFAMPQSGGQDDWFVETAPTSDYLSLSGLRTVPYNICVKSGDSVAVLVAPASGDSDLCRAHLAPGARLWLGCRGTGGVMYMLRCNDVYVGASILMPGDMTYEVVPSGDVVIETLGVKTGAAGSECIRCVAGSESALVLTSR